MTDSLTSHSEIRSTCKLIVLFPASAPFSPDQARRIWEIARAEQANVTLLGLTNDFGKESQLRRKLITMAAFIKYPGIATDIIVEHGTDWAGQIKKIWQAGDSIACYEGHKVGFLHKPLDLVLEATLDAPIYLISGYQPSADSNSSFWSSAITWSGAIAIIAGFLWIEIMIAELPPDWAHTLLSYLGILAVFVLLILWSSLFS